MVGLCDQGQNFIYLFLTLKFLWDNKGRISSPSEFLNVM